MTRLTRRNALAAGLRLAYVHPLMKPYRVIGIPAERPTPHGYLLHPDEIIAVEAMRRGRRSHPYSGNKAA